MIKMISEHNRWFGMIILAWVVSGSAELSAQRLQDVEAPQVNSSASIKWTVGQELLLLRSQTYFAGAISSIRFRNVEFIDAADHGRLLSGAIQLDGWGECLNPTLPGSLADKYESSSVLLSARANSNSYESSTRMGYWLRPGEFHYVNPATGQTDHSVPQPCEQPPADQTQRSAINVEATSHVVYTQRMKLGYEEISNAVLDEISFDLREDHSKVIVEALTGYMPAGFSEFYLYNAATRTFVRDGEVETHPGEQLAPIIAATPNGTSALGIVSLTLDPVPRYGRWVFDRVVKWNVVFRPQGLFSKGVHKYRCVWIIGSLEEVKKSLVSVVKYSSTKPMH